MERFSVILDESNSQLYCPRPIVKHAVVKSTGGEYVLSGGVQRFDGQHVMVMDERGHYGVNHSRFFATHQAVPGEADRYYKVGNVRAWCSDRLCELVTEIDGNEEIVALVQIGDFVVQNPEGEQYAVSAEIFAERYILVE